MKPRLFFPLASIAAVALATACSNPTSSGCDQPGGVAGRWSYQGIQETPVRATIAGTIVLASSNCVDFQGTLDIVEVLAGGASRRLAGPVSGTMVEGTLLLFEASVDGASREHLGRLQGDTLSGTWVVSSGTQVGSGEFSGRRQAQ